MDSPRGRIYLMKMGAEGGVAQMDKKFVGHFDKCLGCMACVTACPSGVQYGKLIEATRAQIERNYKRPFLDRLFRKLIFSLFPYPNRLRWLMLPLWLYQRSGLRWLLRKSGLFTLCFRASALDGIALTGDLSSRSVCAASTQRCCQSHVAAKYIASRGVTRQRAPAGWRAAGLRAARFVQ